MTNVALIVAAGRGSRATSSLPKQYARIGGVGVLSRTIRAFANHPAIDRIQVVIHPDDAALYDECVVQDGLHGAKLLPPVGGGASRQASVRAGLDALAPSAPSRVLIHDAARPFVSTDVISRVLDALSQTPGAIAGRPLFDSLKRAAPSGHITGAVDRAGLWQAQTPQGFAFADILKAHHAAAVAGRHDLTDDAAVAEFAGIPVLLVEGDADNIKLTTTDDLERAERGLSHTMNTAFEPRIGTGFDVHRFTQGQSVWLCGVEIPHTHKLEGHSDADVGLHALTDALLGAIGDGDIGQHFPPSDPQWKGAASHLFLADAARRVRQRGGRIVNVDVTLLAEAPRVGPHRPAMQSVIAGILGLSPDRVGIKATTTEGLGFTGRREGIAAQASALVLLPAGADL